MKIHPPIAVAAVGFLFLMHFAFTATAAPATLGRLNLQVQRLNRIGCCDGPTISASEQ